MSNYLYGSLVDDKHVRDIYYQFIFVLDTHLELDYLPYDYKINVLNIRTKSKEGFSLYDLQEKSLNYFIDMLVRNVDWFNSLVKINNEYFPSKLGLFSIQRYL